jgi:Spy/CpxP family protein refolding chaperone
MHHIGLIVLVSALTFFALGFLRRVIWRRHHRGFGHHGGGGHGYGRRYFIRRALDRFGATGEQRQQVEEVEAKLREDVFALRQGYRQLMVELGEMLPGEQLDTGALDRLSDSLMDLTGKLRSDLRQALLDLHQKATPEQRKRLATMLRHRFA